MTCDVNMTRAHERGRGALYALAFIFASLWLLAGASAWMARVGWPIRAVMNRTPSMPAGLYLLEARRGGVARDDVVAITPPARAIALGCAREGQVLLKRVIAIERDVVCVSKDGISVRGERAWRSPGAPDMAHELAFVGCVQLGAGEVFLATRHPRSCDSRYFGAVRAQAIEHIASPYLTDDD